MGSPPGGATPKMLSPPPPPGGGPPDSGGAEPPSKTRGGGGWAPPPGQQLETCCPPPRTRDGSRSTRRSPIPPENRGVSGEVLPPPQFPCPRNAGRGSVSSSFLSPFFTGHLPQDSSVEVLDRFQYSPQFFRSGKANTNFCSAFHF